MKIRRDVKRLLSENALQNEYVKQNVKQPIITFDQTVKPHKTLILRAWLINTYKVNEQVALQNVKRVKRVKQNVKQSVKHDVKHDSTPNVEFYERLITAKDETITVKDNQIKELIEDKIKLQDTVSELFSSLERKDILLQTALKTPQLTAAPTVEPQRPTAAPPLLKYVVVAILTVLAAAAIGYTIAVG